MRTTSLLFLSLLLGACGPNQEDFFMTMGEELCEKAEECLDNDLDDYTGFDDIGECVDSYEDMEDDFNDIYADDHDCEYDRSKARECLAAIRDVECDDDEDEFLEELEEALEDCEIDDIFDCDEDAIMNDCESAYEDIKTKFEDCGIEVADSEEGEETECTDEQAALMSCVADCYSVFDCSAFDGTDAKLSLDLGSCIAECATR